MYLILYLIILLSIASFALRASISSIEVAYYVAKRANEIRLKSEKAVIATGTVNKNIYRATKIVDAGFTVIGGAAKIAKPAILLSTRATLRVLKFIVTALRNAFIALEGLVLILDIVIFLILVAASAGFLVLYGTTDDNGNIVLNSEMVLSGSSTAGSNTSSEEEEDDSSSNSNADFPKYNLSNEELRKLANLCYQEQGSEAGSAAEASLMCNLYESSRGSGYSSVYDYARNSGWFARAGYHMDNGNAPEVVVTIVTNVIKGGYRTLPKYVDEHDCFSDISSATNDGKAINVSDKSQYKKNVTILHNVYGSTYTFYCFPDSISDPFGYTSEDLRSQVGDACYTFEEAKRGGN